MRNIELKNGSIMEIREMTPEDAAETAALEAEIFSMPWSENGFMSALQSKDTLYLVTYIQGKLAAYCGLLQSFDEADITNVAVREEYRGMGIGGRMLEELMKLGGSRGITRYTLEVRAGNEAAIGLYQKLGFISAGIRPGFYEKPKEDAVIMWLE